MNDAQVVSAIATWAAARRLPEVYRTRWIGLPPAARAALLELAQTLNLRTGQFVTAFTLLDEISVRDGASIDAILRRRAVRGVGTAPGSTPGKGRALLATLRALRYPELHATLERLTARLAGLGLPTGVRVVLPPHLSSAELRVELTAQGGAEMQRLIAAIAARSTELGRIADQLGGTDEV